MKNIMFWRNIFPFNFIIHLIIFLQFYRLLSIKAKGLAC